MTRLRFLRLAPLALLAAAAPVQQPPVPAAAPATAAATPVAATQDADPALWVVKDRDTTIYLFGTIHVLKPGLSWFDEAVKKAFDASNTLVLELVTPDPATMQKLVLEKGISTSGPTLTEQLPPAERARYAAVLKELGYPANAFDRMKPWLAATNLSVLPMEKLGYAPDNGPEAVLTAAAKRAGKPVIGLETAEQQLGFLAGLSPKGQMAFLTDTIDEMPKSGDAFATMVDDWSRGDPEALGRILNQDVAGTPELSRVLLLDRNQRWAQWIKARLAKPGTVFVAVGAGHLAGKGSVIADLGQLHVRVRRVRY